MPRFFTLVLMLSPIMAFCDDSVSPARWQGMIDGGYTSSMGSNSGSKDTFRGKTALTYNGSYWVQSLSLEGLSVRDASPDTNDSERYLASYKDRHFFGAGNFFTIRLQWEKDLLSTSEYQAFTSLGLGRDLLKNSQHHLKIETGPGIRHSELRYLPAKDEGIALLSWDYDWTISPDTRFIHKGTIEAGQYNVISRLNSQLKQNMTKVLALTVSHDYKHDNGDNNTREGIFSIGLHYQF